MDAYVGTILPWPINFAPKGWLFCNGQLLNITQYQALFALLGTYYGGDGRTTFALPNLNGRIPAGAYMGGVDTSTTKYSLGNTGGVESNTLTVDQLPRHTHSFTSSAGSVISSGNASVEIPVSSTNGSTGTPGTKAVLGLATASGKPVSIYSTSSPDTTLKPFTVPVEGEVSVNGTIGSTGNGSPIDNRQPFAALNFIICFNGTFPERPNE